MTVHFRGQSPLRSLLKSWKALFCDPLIQHHFLFLEESGSDEDFMMDDDDDSDYGRSKKKGKKVITKRSKPERKEKKSPKPRLKATGMSEGMTHAQC